jgi:MFS family permease
MSETSQTAPANWRNLAAAFAAISVFGFAFGMSYPLLSLILEQRGVAPELIGINAAMSPIGILLASPVIPVLARRYGSRNVAMVAAALTAVLILSYKIFDRLDVWFILRLLQGVSVSTLFVLSESWIVKFSDHARRGRIVAVYGSVLSASFGAGPALISWIGIDGWLPFVIGAGVIACGLIPLAMVNDDSQPAPHEAATSSVMSFIPKAPMLLAAIGMFAIFDAATLSLLPVYGVAIGLSLPTATNALTALIVGNVVLQFPIGWLADHYPKRALHAALALLTAVMCGLLPFVMGHWTMWPVLLIAGATGFGMYTVGLAALGDRFEGEELIAGNAAFAAIWGIGALVGSVIAGWAMAGCGPHGLPYMLVACFLVVLAAMAWRASTLQRR